MTCSGQVSPVEVRLEMEGDLDDPAYIKASGREPVSGRPNVAALCAGVSSSQLDHFVVLMAKPAGFGVPGPQRFSLAGGWLEHLDVVSQPLCQTELDMAVGDRRIDLTRPEGMPRRRITERPEAVAGEEAVVDVGGGARAAGNGVPRDVRGGRAS